MGSAREAGNDPGGDGKAPRGHAGLGQDGAPPAKDDDEQHCGGEGRRQEEQGLEH
ncbi:MAG: hypothetical protein M3301_05840 [Chloroflexota bacterium]|nr:hypothetical protein [Chloroflexota bacterium]